MFERIRLTRHAKDQIQARGFDAREVLDTVNQHAYQIERSGAFEVRVIVRRFHGYVCTAPDGSTGDNIVACIDPQRRTIKTVMYQHSWQIERKSDETPYF